MDYLNRVKPIVDHRHRFPDVQTHLVDGSSDYLISDLASSAIDVAFVAEDYPGWSDKSLSVWRVVLNLDKAPIRNPGDMHHGINPGGDAERRVLWTGPAEAASAAST